MVGIHVLPLCSKGVSILNRSYPLYSLKVSSNSSSFLLLSVYLFSHYFILCCPFKRHIRETNNPVLVTYTSSHTTSRRVLREDDRFFGGHCGGGKMKVRQWFNLIPQKKRSLL